MMSSQFAKKLVLIFCIVSSLLPFTSAPIRASENFHTTLTSTYTIQQNGETQVKKEFHIRNLKSTVYLKKYGIELQSNRISQVKVFDIQGAIPSNITQTDTKTTIGLEFAENTSVVGKDKVRSFTIEYLDPDVAIYEGNILEAHIPRLLQPEEFDEYTVQLIVPANFTLPTLSEPEEYEVQTDETYTRLSYSTKEIRNGISALFGDQQQYSFRLTYDLENPSQSQGTVQIALPPDTQYQRVVYDSIEPPPQTIETDFDGNWIATYQLETQGIQTVQAQGNVTVFLRPQPDIPVLLPNKKVTQPDQYWESDAEAIRNLAQQYSTPQEIFEYVVHELHYNYARLQDENTRLGAVQALQTPDNAVCQEFTDLFISLARANEIPARQVIGYAFTNNPQIRPLSLVRDILHAWPEYFDTSSSTWKPVDPTWTNTTGGVDYFSQLDFNHIAFVLQGQSSQKPYPPGSYRTSTDQAKNVEISISKDIPTKDFSADIQVSAPVSSPFGLNNRHVVTITNTSGKAWYNVPIHFSANEGISLSQNIFVIEHFLPFQTVTLPLSVTDSQASQPHEEVVIISMEDTVTRHTVRAGSRWSRWYTAIQHPLTATIVFTSIIAVTGIMGIIIFQGRKKQGKS